MVGDELLSAFKVASFAAFEEDKEVPSTEQEPDDESKDWVSYSISRLILKNGLDFSILTNYNILYMCRMR
jgi:hypothetical protein